MDSTNSMESKVKTMSKPRRILYTGLGSLFTGLGVLGIITPVLPTTIFLILASGFFIRSSPRLHQRIHRSKITGAYLRVYTQGAGLSRARKLSTIAVLWVSLGVSAWIVKEIPWLIVLLAVIGLAITVHVATIKPHKRKPQVSQHKEEQTVNRTK